MREKMKVVMLEPGKLAYVTEIGTSLEAMQAAVGGYIEAVYPFHEAVCVVCNEEGKLLGLKGNRSLENEEGKIIDFLYGAAFVCDCRGDDFASLSDEQLEYYTKLFFYPELLMRVKGKLVALPYTPNAKGELV